MTARKIIQTFIVAIAATAAATACADSWIRINQLGYLPDTAKAAVFVSNDNAKAASFEIRDALTGETVYTSEKVRSYGAWGPFTNGARLDFTAFSTPGAYYIAAGGVQSPVFRVGWDVYDGAADFLLNYMRQQRCGWNPCLKDSCHTHDGFIIYHPTKENTHIDVTGGWHDASDYLQYTTTSANAVHQMLFAYSQNPGSFGDSYDASGNPGSNGIPDIVDEAKWGLDWLIKMNPSYGEMYNQIADDRDHSGYRLPTRDSTSYGRGLERPVYFCTGTPQGLFAYKNRATGIASTAGKYASAFALGADVMAPFYPEYAGKIAKKALEAYDFGLKNPGACQTAPGGAPYFYEEDNWVDDMELAAYQVGVSTGDNAYVREAAAFGRQERTTPWMGAETARHYEWYPFVNLGHYYLAKNGYDGIRREFQGYMAEGLENIRKRGAGNPFLIGVPFIWCSNNLVAATLTQCRLYREATNDNTYDDMEAALRDWLFGANPWGTSMICGLPANGDFPDDTHSSLSVKYGIPTTGGLVDGPVYGTVFKNLKWLELIHEDEYAPFQSDVVVYHDDSGDYSTNEPTMDGTASLTYYLSGLQKDGMERRTLKNAVLDHGGVVRTDPSKKTITLIFSADMFVDGYDVVRATLKKHKVPAAFFFTGNFYREPSYARMTRELLSDGHYVAAHSDKHLLYCAWENRDSTLVTHDEFIADVKNNYLEMAKFGIKKEDAPYYMPPSEWYNSEISAWAKELGITIVNLTPNTWTNQDWTIPDNPSFPYYSSDDLLGRLANFEKNDPNGLAGTIILVHFGTDPRRTDKLYNRLDGMITDLKRKGYTFTDIRESVGR